MTGSAHEERSDERHCLWRLRSGSHWSAGRHFHSASNCRMLRSGRPYSTETSTEDVVPSTGSATRTATVAVAARTTRALLLITSARALFAVNLWRVALGTCKVDLDTWFRA